MQCIQVRAHAERAHWLQVVVLYGADKQTWPQVWRLQLQCAELPPADSLPAETV